MEEGTENTVQTGTEEDEGYIEVLEEEETQGQETQETQGQETQEMTQATNDYMYVQSDQLELTNHMLAGQIFFLGLIFGVLIFKVFWDRWKV